MPSLFVKRRGHERIRTTPLTSSEWPLLWIGLLPMGVLVLGHLLFDLVGPPFASHARLLMQIRNVDVPSAAIAASEVWAATALIYLVVGFGSVVFLVYIFLSRVRGWAAMPFLGLAAFFSVFGVAHLVMIKETRGAVSTIFYLTFDSLQRSSFLDAARLEGIHLLLNVINLMSLLVPALFCAFLPASLLRPLQGWTGDLLAERIKDGRQFALIASAFLVAGVLHMYAWMHWSAVLLLREEVARLAMSVVFYWSCVFTTMIGVLYLPMLVVLHARAERLMNGLQMPLTSRPKWLNNHGLSYRAVAQVRQMVTIFAPLLSSLTLSSVN